MDDEDLGEVCLSGGIMEQIDQLDMEIFDLLDPKKVGAMQRVNEQGFFTESGYVIKDSEHWQDVYDGMTLPEPVIVADSIVNAIFRRKTKEADMEIINCLEERLTMLNKDELCKYKAVLRFERCRDFEAALCLADQLDDYDFEPDCMTAESYCKEFLNVKSIDTGNPAFQHFDFRSYGESLLEQEHKRLTRYGAVRYHVQPIEMNSDVQTENGIQMM